MEEKEVASEIKELRIYLARHGIAASETDVIAAALRLAKRLGADRWSFVCEMKRMKG